MPKLQLARILNFQSEILNPFIFFTGLWRKMCDLSTGRLLSRISKKLNYLFQQEVIPCSPIFYTILKNYVRSSIN